MVRSGNGEGKGNLCDLRESFFEKKSGKNQGQYGGELPRHGDGPLALMLMRLAGTDRQGSRAVAKCQTSAGNSTARTAHFSVTPFY